MTDDNRECEVPLIEQLRDIPKDYRTVRAIQWDEGGRETGHQFIPVGFMMHRAAAELESQAAEIARLKEDAGRLDRLESRADDWTYKNQKAWSFRCAAHLSLREALDAIDSAKEKS